VPAVRERLAADLRVRRLARRFGRGIVLQRRLAPPSPVGAKLELTYRCNLKCPFCYTDSPRRTRERARDLDDAAWRAVVEEAIDLGVLEAVVTGGEPLLRRELALELIDRLCAEGVGVTMNTNGWFVDEPTADRLAAVSGFQANISIDGATPELHDSARGVPGSWERAVGGVDRLLQRDVRVQVVHVVTPANERFISELLEIMWLLGVRSVRLAVAVPTGAAARAGDWRVDRGALRRRVAAAVERYPDLTIQVQPGTLSALAAIEDVAPAALLVRPNGTVWIDSVRPFGFGNVRDGGLAACWQRIQARWNDPQIVAWAKGLGRADDIPESGVVPYVDEIALEPEEQGQAARPVDTAVIPAGVPDTPPDGGDFREARRHAAGLALERPYRLGRCRSVGTADRYVRVLRDGRTCRLNRTASLVMDACGGGRPADAVAVVSARHPDVPLASIEAETLGSVRQLVERGILEPAVG
jgi:MoaA/NifB/PqqE/SkfB family radical SAM enzyme